MPPTAAVPKLLLGWLMVVQFEGKVMLSTRKFGQVLVEHVPFTTKAIPEVPTGVNCIQDRREVALVPVGVMVNTVTPVLTEIFVAVQEAAAPKVNGEVFGVPVPMIVIPTPAGTVRPVAQVQLPAGMVMVSPLTATWLGPLMTAFTSD